MSKQVAGMILILILWIGQRSIDYLLRVTIILLLSRGPPVVLDQKAPLAYPESLAPQDQGDREDQLEKQELP